MENEPMPTEKPPSPGGGKIKVLFLLLALAPMPIGLLLDPLRLFNVAQGNKSIDSSLLVTFNVLTLLCSIIGAIGICGGFKKGKWIARVVGVAIGLVLWAVEVFSILFIGCCQGFSQIH